LGRIPDAIRIRRPHREVALSAWRRGGVPARSAAALVYNIKPDDADCWLRVQDYAHWTDYQLCYWNCLSIERRCDAGAALLREHGAQVVDTSLAELTTRDGFLSLCRALGLSDPRPEYEDIYSCGSAPRRLFDLPAWRPG